MTLADQILAPLPSAAKYLTFHAQPTATRAELQAALAADWPSDAVIGLGAGLLAAIGLPVAGLHAFPAWSQPGVLVPSTPGDLWVWLRGEDRGELVHEARRLIAKLSGAFSLIEAVDAFTYQRNRDLTGYEDGTENPTGDRALQVALHEGGSFVSVMRWQHDLARFEAMSRTQRDHTIGRRHADNEEIDDAPPSAHVKRTAQESFEPAAFLVRRSMPYNDGEEAGLVFVAFAASLAPFEALLTRMVSAEDGVVDALFSFSAPRTGAHYWCPPRLGARLAL